jgi:hypothetical protein
MLIADLEETFASLREYRWKLNTNKCVFGVPSGKLLGSSSAIAASKPTPRRSLPSPILELPPASKMSRTLPGAWRP